MVGRARPRSASIKYYEQVQERDAGVRDYFRMFLMPGVLHCGGGPGPDTVDWPATIADWVENGKAPDQVIARKAAAGGAVSRTRPLCPYPQHAEYTGAAARTTRRTSSAVSDDGAGLSSAEPIEASDGSADVSRAAVRFLSAAGLRPSLSC